MPFQEDVFALLKNLLPPGEPMPVGATDEAIAGFAARNGLLVPQELREWLKLCNGSHAAGGLYGIETRAGFHEIESAYTYHPEMRDKGWIPVAGDGCGDWYVLDTRILVGSTHPVYFIDHETYEGEADYVVASGLWKFLSFLFENEKITDEENWLGPPRNQPTQTFEQFIIDLEKHMKSSQSYWPFNKKKVLARDPDLKKYRGKVPLAWKAR